MRIASRQLSDPVFILVEKPDHLGSCALHRRSLALHHLHLRLLRARLSKHS